MATSRKPSAKKPAPKKRAPARVKAGTSPEAARLRKIAFVDAYIKNGNNATQAAITAGYSPHTAKPQGSRLLTDVDVQRLLGEVGARLAAKYQLSVAMVERSIAQELAFDPASLYDAQGRLKRITDLDEDTRMALVSVEVDETTATPNSKSALRNKETLLATRTAKIKWAPRGQAREQAMKYLGMFEKDNAQRQPAIGEGAPRQVLETLRDQITAHLATMSKAAPAQQGAKR